MSRSKAAAALAEVLAGAFAIEKALAPFRDGVQGSDLITLADILTQDDTLERITAGVRALREAGSFGSITLAELVEVTGPYVATLAAKGGKHPAS